MSIWYPWSEHGGSYVVADIMPLRDCTPSTTEDDMGSVFKGY